MVMEIGVGTHSYRGTILYVSYLSISWCIFICLLQKDACGNFGPTILRFFFLAQLFEILFLAILVGTRHFMM